jgi:hypothetical protein
VATGISFPVVFASLKPPATGLNPFRMEFSNWRSPRSLEFVDIFPIERDRDSESPTDKTLTLIGGFEMDSRPPYNAFSYFNNRIVWSQK